MTALPTNTRDFTRWLSTMRHMIPFELHQKAERALLAMQVMAGLPPQATEAMKQQTPATWASLIKDLSDFADAYEAWSKSSGEQG